jgi:hypothetical protein
MMTGVAVHCAGKPSDLPDQMFAKLMETSKHFNTSQTQ